MSTCPVCGGETEVKEFSGEGIHLPTINEQVQELVDNIIESTGYGI